MEAHTGKDGPWTCESCGTVVPVGVEDCPRCLLEGALQVTETPEGSPEIDMDQLAADFPQLDIIKEIGRGGMGVVYQARQRNLGRDVALKVLSKNLVDDPNFTERFTRESHALAGLSHPNIIAIHDAGVAGSHHYILMELVDGADLRQLVASGEVEPSQALAIISQVCDGLQYAHDKGVVHRDIKPENVLIDLDGNAKIGDFGLAKLLENENTLRLTGTMQAMGTLHYMAPEQIEHPLEVDHRADIYSLGVVLYELLTGELPIGRFDAPSRRAAVDVKLDYVVMKSLEKEPVRRYQSAIEVKDDLARASSGRIPLAARADEAFGGGVRAHARKVVALVLLVSLAYIAWTNRDYLSPEPLQPSTTGLTEGGFSTSEGVGETHADSEPLDGDFAETSEELLPGEAPPTEAGEEVAESDEQPESKDEDPLAENDLVETDGEKEVVQSKPDSEATTQEEESGQTGSGVSGELPGRGVSVDDDEIDDG
jgi:tRNA A-37 threonylcarbamoyl transferase component Bud32